MAIEDKLRVSFDRPNEHPDSLVNHEPGPITFRRVVELCKRYKCGASIYTWGAHMCYVGRVTKGGGFEKASPHDPKSRAYAQGRAIDRLAFVRKELARWLSKRGLSYHPSRPIPRAYGKSHPVVRQYQEEMAGIYRNFPELKSRSRR